MNYLKIPRLKLSMVLSSIVFSIIALIIFFYYKSQPNYLDQDYYSVFSDGCDPIRKLYFSQDKISKKMEAEDVPSNTVEWDIQYLERMKKFQKEGGFKELEEASLNNNACGAKSATFLKMEYKKLSMENEKNIVHNRLVFYAEQKNPWAVYALCVFPEDDTSSEVTLNYCQTYINEANEKTPQDLIDSAYLMIAHKYATKDLDKMFETCELIHDKSDLALCYASFSFTTNELDDEKNIAMANYHKKIIQFFTALKDAEDLDYYLYYLKINPSEILKESFIKIMDWDSLLALCENVTDIEKKSCMYGIYSTAEELYEKEKHQEAMTLFKNVMSCGEQCGSQELQNSAFYLGEIYLYGINIEHDYEAAITWYKKALRYMNLSNSTNTAYYKNLYFSKIANSYFTLNDYVRASIYFQQCAELGNAGCQMFLGSLYLDGLGVPNDDKEAYAWIGISLIQGTLKEGYAEGAREMKQQAALRLLFIGQKELNAAKQLEKEYYQKYVISTR